MRSDFSLNRLFSLVWNMKYSISHNINNHNVELMQMSRLVTSLFSEANVPTIGVVGVEEGEVKQLLNPDNVSKEALESGLELYRKAMECKDPAIKGALHEAMQVRTDERPSLWEGYELPCRARWRSPWRSF